jgi:hypothetical protein
MNTTATPIMLRWALVLLSATVTVGCGSGGTNKEAKKPQAVMLGIEIRGDAEVEKYDLNGDGAADVWKYFVRKAQQGVAMADLPRLLARQDLDLNFDNAVDVRRHFNASGNVVREEMDLDFDTKFDATDYYAEGVLYRRDVSLNFEGTPTIIKFYNDNKLTRKERDTDSDGKMDLIEYYENGKLVRIGEDRDGDGNPDVYRDIVEGS